MATREGRGGAITYSASITVTAGGDSQTFKVMDIDFEQPRDGAAIGIGRSIMDFIYKSTEDKRKGAHSS